MTSFVVLLLIIDSSGVDAMRVHFKFFITLRPSRIHRLPHEAQLLLVLPATSFESIFLVYALGLP